MKQPAAVEGLGEQGEQRLSSERKLGQGSQCAWTGMSRDGTEVVADKVRETGQGQVGVLWRNTLLWRNEVIFRCHAPAGQSA